MRECFQAVRDDRITIRDAVAKGPIFNPAQRRINRAHFALTHFIQIIEDIKIADFAAITIKWSSRCQSLGA
jgi:hypothetical protein